MSTIVSSSSRINGTADNDFIFAKSLNSIVTGGSGNDVILGDSGPVRRSGFVDLDNPIFYTNDRNPLVDEFFRPHTTISVQPNASDNPVKITLRLDRFEFLRVDVDYADSDLAEFRGGRPVDLVVEIFDSFGNSVAYDDDVGLTPDDIGSDSGRDPYLEFEANFSDRYTISIGKFSGDPFSGEEAFLVNVTRDPFDSSASVPEGDDVLVGGQGSDHLFGVAGNDTLRGGTGDDLLDGGVGTDWAVYNDTSGGVIVNLITGRSRAQFTGNAGFDQLVAIESVAGSRGSDSITGNDFANEFTGGADDDIIRARGGRDTINGGAQNDTIEGGTGSDFITTGTGFDRVIVRPSHGRDEVLDFHDRDDVIDLRSFNTTDGRVLDATRATARGTFIDLPGADGVLLVGFDIRDFGQDDILT